MEKVKITGKKSKRIMERYTDRNGKMWVRLKYQDESRTEVVMAENEFNRIYGIFD